MHRLFQIAYRLHSGLSSRLRNVYYRLLGVRFSGYVWLRRISIPYGWHGITLESGVALDEGVQLKISGEPTPDKLRIGSGTYINAFTIITAGESVDIGRDCMIGPHCFIADAIHGTSADQSLKAQITVYKPVLIEDGVWLGAGCVVLAGVRLGAGCVIGAGSVVSQDIPAGTIALSASTRVIKSRV